MPWHRIRLGSGAFESASEQQYFVNLISDWIEKRSAALSQLGVSLRTEQAEIYSEWDGDEKVWHLNDVALNVYREVGGGREVEDVVDRLPTWPSARPAAQISRLGGRNLAIERT